MSDQYDGRTIEDLDAAVDHVMSNHPNLSPEINRAIAQSEIDGGAWVEKLLIGKSLKVRTKNTLYTIERRADGFYISGNARYCPTPTMANIHGSTWGGSMLKVGFIGRDMHLEFSLPEFPDYGIITTTCIQEVGECL